MPCYATNAFMNSWPSYNVTNKLTRYIADRLTSILVYRTTAAIFSFQKADCDVIEFSCLKKKYYGKINRSLFWRFPSCLLLWLQILTTKIGICGRKWWRHSWYLFRKIARHDISQMRCFFHLKKFFKVTYRIFNSNYIVYGNYNYYGPLYLFSTRRSKI